MTRIGWPAARTVLVLGRARAWAKNDRAVSPNAGDFGRAHMRELHSCLETRRTVVAPGIPSKQASRGPRAKKYPEVAKFGLSRVCAKYARSVVAVRGACLR
jgi:hypothetical protein